MNFTNRNASSSQRSEEILTAYLAATSAAVSVACGLRAMTPILLKGRQQSAVGSLASYFIGYAAVASSSSLNVYFMRKNEINTGVVVKDMSTG